jgi:hypothetical protein
MSAVVIDPQVVTHIIRSKINMATRSSTVAQHIGQRFTSAA